MLRAFGIDSVPKRYRVM